MNLVDSHAHLDTFDENGDLEPMLTRAREAGLSRLIAIGGSPDANRRACRIAKDVPWISATVGYDRDLAGKDPDLQALEQCAAEPGVVAIGETGLDYHYEPETRDQQRLLFQDMLDVAHRRTLPVVVHSREAEVDILDHLKKQHMRQQGPAGSLGVLHCFTGDLAFAEALLDLGMYISFSGIMTFKNAEQIRQVAAAIPLDRILIETDAPYLAPVPHRGKTNEPAYVAYVAARLAELRGESLEVVIEQTHHNSLHLFQWDTS